MPSASHVGPHGGRRRRQPSFLQSCFASPSITDPDNDNVMPSAPQLPNSFWSRFRRHRRTVPVEDPLSGDMPQEEPVAHPPPAGNRRKGFPQKLRKELKPSKKTAKPQDHGATSGGTHTVNDHRQTSVCHVSSRTNQPTAPCLRPRAPVQAAKRSIQAGSPRRSRPAGLPDSTRHRPGAAVLLLLLALTVALAVIIFFGRLCAVFCACGCFYLIPSGWPSPPETGCPEAVDVNSAEYKKRVVLMGLLERGRLRTRGMRPTPVASPARPR